MKNSRASLPSSLLLGGLALVLVGCPGNPAPPADRTPVAGTAPAKPDFAVTQECGLPSDDDLLGDEVVQWAFRTAIHRSVVEPESSSFMLEEGGWLYQCRRKGAAGRFEYYLDAVLVEGTYRGRTMIDLDERTYYAHKPDSLDCRTVGMFHTHPDVGEYYEEPSDEDRENAGRLGLPAFVIKNETRFAEAKTSLPKFHPRSYGKWGEAGKENLSWPCEQPTASATIVIDSPDLGRITMALRAASKGGTQNPRFSLAEVPGQSVVAFTISSEDGALEIYAPARVGSWSGTDGMGGVLVRVHPKEAMLSQSGHVLPYQLAITQYVPGRKIAGAFRGEMRRHSKEMGDSTVVGTFYSGPPDERPSKQEPNVPSAGVAQPAAADAVG
jgi:proteasome lid subunit RPN8/RPN11